MGAGGLGVAGGGDLVTGADRTGGAGGLGGGGGVLTIGLGTSGARAAATFTGACACGRRRVSSRNNPAARASTAIPTGIHHHLLLVVGVSGAAGVD